MPKKLPITLKDIRARKGHVTSLKDIYWLAGILEGEGTFRPTSHNQLPQISFVSTDFDVAVRVSGMLNAVSIYCRTDKFKRKKDSYLIQIVGKSAAAWMMTLYSLMGQRRKARIKETLAIYHLP